MPEQRLTRAQQIANNLRDELGNGSWTAGARLPSEAAMASSLSVSRSTVREAVRLLQSLGLLEVRHGNGTFVRAINQRDAVFERELQGFQFADLVGACQAIELNAVVLWDSRNDTRSLMNLATAGVRAAQSPSGPDLEIDRRFHAALVSGTNNELLHQLHRQLSAAIRAGGSDDMTNRKLACWAKPDLHQLVARALTTRDLSVAAVAVRKQFLNADGTSTTDV